MARKDLFRLAHSSKVDAGVPAQEYIDIDRYIFQLRGGGGRSLPRVDRARRALWTRLNVRASPRRQKWP